MTPQALAQHIAARFALVPQVEAVALAGSQAAGWATTSSDIDVYIYTRQAIPAQDRLAIAREWSVGAQLNDFWGDGLEWDDAGGIHVDAVFFEVGFMQHQVERVVIQHQASMGYSTSFWHTVRISQALFDRDGWFSRLHELAQRPYPPALAHAIINLNFPLLRDIFSSYIVQLEKAQGRHDVVSLNHRSAAFLASVFDIIFAVNRIPHVGEKRLLDLTERLCPNRPVAFRQQVEAFLRACAFPEGQLSASEVALLMVADLETVLRSEGYLRSAPDNLHNRTDF